ncbi:MAG: NAD(P)H-binding protein [Propionibacteriales bacterium]|nr:NAD(P)H-binding protein [Propionibacteriales bacterium]
MRVVIAGGHGKIGLRLGRLLSGRGDQAVGLIRNSDHVADLEDAGVRPVVLDLERAAVGEVGGTLDGADAVVFAAGAGPGSGAARKDTVDRDAAILLADAAGAAGVRRYLMVSAIRVDRADPTSDDVFQVYLRAKAAADADLRSRDLDWTIVRPGGLTDDPGTGHVTVGESLEPGQVTRDDVAGVLLAALDHPEWTVRKQFDLIGGTASIATGLAAL